MGRKRKTLIQVLKASALAHLLAVLAGVKPNGHQLARWYERELGLPHESESNSTWGRFLEGLMPQKTRLAILLDLEPALVKLFNHPLWDIMDEESDLVDIYSILKNRTYPKKSFYLSSLEDDMSTMSALDRIALFVLMILSAEDHESTVSIVTNWLADSYAQLSLEPEWFYLSTALSNLILIRFESVPWFSSAEFISSNNEANHKFWSAIFDDYKENKRDLSPATWAVWCGSVSRLNWLERKAYLEFVGNASPCDSDEKKTEQIYVYRKVRNRRYELIRKARRLSIDFLMGN
ncbi:hypothetical protein [Pseudomonas sp. OV226]|uniref:hypothetical protein n=1 Tax=Pseudomonas sp. OV226 TaxID=2135588 RepID=UPI000D7B6E6B|nr:hypothetical protein [Pseudomonas sp. OV226]PWK33651.1 hypothetical protein C7534_11889 [Pseudomonas sp. OV226]